MNNPNLEEAKKSFELEYKDIAENFDKDSKGQYTDSYTVELFLDHLAYLKGILK